MCRLSGHYMPRLMTIAAKRLSPLTQSPPLTQLQPNIASHTAKHADNDDNNRTFSHLQLKAGRFKICGEWVRCQGGKSCCIICPLGALCIAPYKKISSGALRVRFVSRSTSFRDFFFFFVSFLSYFVRFIWYIYFVFLFFFFCLRLYCLLFSCLDCNLILIYVLYYAHLHKL